MKRTLTILFLVTVLAIGGSGLAGKSLAQDHSCSNFTIQLTGVTRDHGDVFLYKYTVSGGELPVSKISLLEFGIEGTLAVTATNNVKVFAPGVGGLGSDDWLVGVPQLQVLNITAQSYTESVPLILEVAGSGGNIGTVAAHTQAGNKLETCFIQGPVTGLPVDVSVPPTKQIVLNDIEFCVDVDPRTGCPYPNSTIYQCDDPSNVLDPDPDFVLGSYNPADGNPTTPTMVYGEGSDPRCPIAKAAHNPCQWVILSGRPYGPVCW